MVSGFGPYLLSAGGNFMNIKSREVFINNAESVPALDFYAGLLVRDRVAAPEVTTWEFDEIIANGQNDRYAMVSTFAPYGTLMNDSALSRTAGRWSFALAPGATDIQQSKVTLGGWMMGVSRHGKHKDWALEFIQLATNKEWLRRSMFRGNAAPRQSVLNNPAIQAAFPWAPVSADALPSVPMTMRHRPPGSLPLRATGETSTWSCSARQPEIAFPPVALRTRKAVGRRWFQRHRRRRPNWWTGRAADGPSRRPTRFASLARPTAPGLAVAAPSFDARGSTRRL